MKSALTGFSEHLESESVVCNVTTRVRGVFGVGFRVELQHHNMQMISVRHFYTTVNKEIVKTSMYQIVI